MHIFCSTHGPTREMEMHGVANLATLQTPLAIFFPFKKSIQTLFSLWESPSTAVWAPGLAFTACAHTYLSLSASGQFLFSTQLPAEKSSALTLLNTDIILLASLILHDASIAEITAPLLSLSLCIWFHKTTARLSGFLCRLTSWKWELVI